MTWLFYSQLRKIVQSNGWLSVTLQRFIRFSIFPQGHLSEGNGLGFSAVPPLSKVKQIINKGFFLFEVDSYPPPEQFTVKETNISEFLQLSFALEIQTYILLLQWYELLYSYLFYLCSYSFSHAQMIEKFTMKTFATCIYKSQGHQQLIVFKILVLVISLL